MSNDSFRSVLANPLRSVKVSALKIIPLFMIIAVGLIVVVALGLTQGWKAAVIAGAVTAVAGAIYIAYLAALIINTGAKMLADLADDAFDETNRPGQVPPASTHDWTNGGDYFNESKPTDIKP